MPNNKPRSGSGAVRRDYPPEGLDHDHRVEILTTEECQALLHEHHFGRVAFVDTVGVLPLIIPVNYVWEDGAVVFRTDSGSKLRAAARGAPVAFEIDGLDQERRVGWSVVVRGHAREITDPTRLAELGQLPLVAWSPRGEAALREGDAQSPDRSADQRLRPAVTLVDGEPVITTAPRGSR
jgi:nitroimidazol reductase NimA-like FMN-containing flavoprotein (pyridoxamine 5'-phosphate oxidase superfamily)